MSGDRKRRNTLATYHHRACRRLYPEVDGRSIGRPSHRGWVLRAKVEASIGRYKRVIGDTLRSRTDQTEATEVALAAAALNRGLGARTISVSIK
jgi:hypothetical protein